MRKINILTYEASRDDRHNKVIRPESRQFYDGKIRLRGNTIIAKLQEMYYLTMVVLSEQVHHCLSVSLSQLKNCIILLSKYFNSVFPSIITGADGMPI